MRRGVLPSTLFERSHFKASQALFPNTRCPSKCPGALQNHTRFCPSSSARGPGTPGAEPRRVSFRQAPSARLRQPSHSWGQGGFIQQGARPPSAPPAGPGETRCPSAQREARCRDPWLPSDRLLEVVPGPPSQGLLRVDLHLSQAQDDGVNFCS